MAADCVRLAPRFTGRLSDQEWTTRMTHNHHFTPSLFPTLLPPQVRYDITRTPGILGPEEYLPVT